VRIGCDTGLFEIMNVEGINSCYKYRSLVEHISHSYPCVFPTPCEDFRPRPNLRSR
jgi:hypothetical protein